MSSKNLIILIFFILALTSLQSKGQMTSGYYVVPSSKMSEDIRTQLSNKLKVTLSKAGLSVTDNYFPMITVINYDENDVIEVPGIRKSYKALGTVSVYIIFDNSSSLLSATSFEVEGVGNSIDIAQSNAIKRITRPQNELESLLNKAKENYLKSLDDYSNKKLLEARAYFANNNYEEAIYILNEIPVECSSHKQAQELLDKITRQKEKERLDRIETERRKSEQLIKDQQERIIQRDKDRQENAYQMEKEREHEREMERIKQGNETKREEIRNRSSVEKTISKLWTSIFGKK